MWKNPDLPAPMGTIAADTGVSMGTFHEEKMIIGISGSNTIKEEPERRLLWVQDTMVKGLSLDESKLTDKVVFCRYP